MSIKRRIKALFKTLMRHRDERDSIELTASPASGSQSFARISVGIHDSLTHDNPLPTHAWVAPNAEEHQIDILSEVIGTGTYSTVYKGTCDGKPAAHKVAKTDQKYEQFFNNEVKALRSVSHLNIIQLLDYQSDDGAAPDRITLTYCSRGTLRQRIYNVLLPDIIWETFGKQIATDIASGLYYLHYTALCLHRDIKPDNILLDEAGHAVIADFGFSCSIQSSEHIVTITNGFICGSPPYMAPEIFFSLQYSQKSDIYAFAMTMYEMLTRRMPFKELYDCSKLKCSLKQAERPFIFSDISPDAVNLITHMWSHNPVNRPTSKRVLELLEESGKSPSPH